MVRFAAVTSLITLAAHICLSLFGYIRLGLILQVSGALLNLFAIMAARHLQRR